MKQFSAATRSRVLKPLRAYATLGSPNVAPGASLHGFTVNKVKEVPEFKLVATTLRHDKTGAEHIHLSRDDRNNVFGIGFGTPSLNSTGVAHILEHTTLCGSTKYPVRDPFFKMYNRSYSDTMNAYTAQYYTLYPYSTTNLVDYENLRSVYLDLIFNPLLRTYDFRQEGWRLEHTDPRDPSSPIIFKGVVFNEMKGVLSNAASYYREEFQEHMYKHTIYGVNSGGNPLDILDLTSQQLRSFHNSHYHPSNSKSVTYGNIPLSQHLEVLNRQFDQFTPRTPSPFSTSSTRFTAPQTIETTGPIDPLADPKRQTITSIAFHTNELSDGIFAHFALDILFMLLTDGHSAPMHKALLDTGLGTGYSPITYHEMLGKTAFAAFGLEGVSADDEGRVEVEIFKVLQECAEKGFEKDRVEGVLHQLELSLKHDSAQFGMRLLFGITRGWFDGVDPVESILLKEQIGKLREKLAEGPFFEGLIRKYFLENESRLVFTMRPDPEFEVKLKEREKTKLAERVSVLSEAEKEEVYKEGLALLQVQGESQDVSVLPTLTVDDIPKQEPSYPLIKETKSPRASEGLSTPVLSGKRQDTDVYWRHAATNGITYFKALIPLNGLPSELRPYLSILADALSSLGTKTKSASDFENEILLKTDGIAGSTVVTTNPHDLDVFQEYLGISTACLDQNIPDMYNLLRQFVFETNWDNEAKLSSLIKTSASGLVNSVADSGSRYAALYAGSKLTQAKAAAEVVDGMTQIRLLSQLAMRESYADVIQKLKALAAFVIERQDFRIAITCGEESKSENDKNLTTLLTAFPRSGNLIKTPKIQLPTLPSKGFFNLPFPIYYTALALRGVPFSHPDSPALSILAKVIEDKYMHPEIREKGGAYGGNALYGQLDGIFRLTSYRDPSFARSLKVMRNAGEWASQQTFETSTLGEMKLQIFKRRDAPIDVRDQGMDEFINQVDWKTAQTWRELGLGVTNEQVQSVAHKYLVEGLAGDKTSEAVLGEITAEIQNDKEWEKFNFEESQEYEDETMEAIASN